MSRSGSKLGLSQYLSSSSQVDNMVRVLCMLSLVSIWLGRSAALAASVDFDLNEDMSLDLSLQGELDSTPANKVPESVLVNQVLIEDVSDDFKATEYALIELEKRIQDLYQRLQIGPATQLAHKFRQLGQPIETMNKLTVQVIEEINLIANTYFTTFKPQVVGIITERPPNLQPTDLAFRCTRINDINNLKKFGSASQLYQITLDVFFSELYSHCLIRRLVLLEINNVQPSSLVRQFVDIYLDLPPVKFNPPSIDRILNGASVNFKLPEALRKHGPLTSVSQYIIDPKASLVMSPDGSLSTRQELVSRFKGECRLYLKQLQTYWTDFDQVAHLFTSPMNNLSLWNDQIKQLVPRLVYGSICNQLASVA